MTAEKDVQVARKKTFFFKGGVPLCEVGEPITSTGELSMGCTKLYYRLNLLSTYLVSLITKWSIFGNSVWKDQHVLPFSTKYSSSQLYNSRHYHCILVQFSVIYSRHWCTLVSDELWSHGCHCFQWWNIYYHKELTNMFCRLFTALVAN